LQELGFESYKEELKDFMRNYNSEKEDRAHIAVVNRKRIVETDE